MVESRIAGGINSPSVKPYTAILHPLLSELISKVLWSPSFILVVIVLVDKSEKKTFPGVYSLVDTKHSQTNSLEHLPSNVQNSAN